MAKLLSILDMPDGFEYPSEFVRVVEFGLTNLEPWWIIEGDMLRDRFVALKKRYEQRLLVPSPPARTSGRAASLEGYEGFSFRWTNP